MSVRTDRWAKADSTKKKTGRPLKYSAHNFKTAIDAYLKKCDETGEIPLMVEFCTINGFSESTLKSYRERPAYQADIKRLDEASHIGWIRLAERTNKPIFPIFMLKAKFGYIEQEKSGVQININGQGVIALPKNPDKQAD